MKKEITCRICGFTTYDYQDMVEMFKAGKEPRSYQSILNCVSVLEALEKSVKTEKWVDVEYQTIK